MINGIDPDDRSGHRVSAAGDVNGDGLADVIVGAYEAAPAGNGAAGESYVIFGPVSTCPWDCADGNGSVETLDFLTLLGQWGQIGAPCDLDGDGVGTSDFLALLGHWGACRP